RSRVAPSDRSATAHRFARGRSRAYIPGAAWEAAREPLEGVVVIRSSRRAFLALSACLALGAALFAGSSLANAVQPYGTNDAGGFRNVLPPGENGLDNLPQVLSFKATKTLPPHYDDQQPLYENLLYGAPTLTDEQIPNYFKDATFGVPANEVESSIEPKPGVTILRDKA